MADNAEWLTKLNYIEMLRDVGRHFSINRMLTMDSVKLRLDREQELSFIEFNYMILQSYDFVELAQALRLQSADGRLRPVGQHRQRRRSRPAHGHASALRADLPAADHIVGRQDGQDRGGRGVAQRRHAARLRLLAVLAQHRGRRRRPLPEAVHHLPLDEIARLGALEGQEINEAKKVLATEATALLHGRAAAEQAADTARTHVRGRRGCGKPADRRNPERPNCGLGRAHARSSTPGWSPRPARRGVRSRAAD